MAKKRGKGASPITIIVLIIIAIILGIFSFANLPFLQESWWNEINVPYVITELPLTNWQGGEIGETTIQPQVCSGNTDVGWVCGASRTTFIVPNYNPNKLLFLGILYDAKNPGGYPPRSNWMLDQPCGFERLEDNYQGGPAYQRYQCYLNQIRSEEEYPGPPFDTYIEHGFAFIDEQVAVLQPNTQHILDVFQSTDKEQGGIAVFKKDLIFTIWTEVECTLNNHCANGFICQDFQCIEGEAQIPEEPTCNSNDDCPSGEICASSGEGVNLKKYCAGDTGISCESGYDCLQLEGSQIQCIGGNNYIRPLKCSNDLHPAQFTCYVSDEIIPPECTGEQIQQDQLNQTEEENPIIEFEDIPQDPVNPDVQSPSVKFSKALPTLALIGFIAFIMLILGLVVYGIRKGRKKR